MSTATPQPAAHPTPAAPSPKREILIVSHSGLFYWWPVWAVCFLMGLITWFSGDHMATVPHKSVEIRNAKLIEVTEADATKPKLTFENRDAIIAPEKATMKELRVSSSKNLGVIFCVVLLVVIGITNVPLRGLWSVILIILVVALVIIMALLPGGQGEDGKPVSALEKVLEWLSILDIRINQAGYFVLGIVLFTLWILIFLLFDRQIYMIFSPGQFRVKLEIGDAETAYDTTGMTIQKQRSDLFRHWILGFGSGDLIVRTAGAQGHHFDMPNVLFLGRRVREIEDMLRSRQVVTTGQNA
jgi:hypothetical protein